MIRALKRLRSLRALYLPGDLVPGLSPEEEKRLIEKGYAERVPEARDEPKKTVAKDPEPAAEKAEVEAEPVEPAPEKQVTEAEETEKKPSGKPKTKKPRERGSGKKGAE